VCRGIALLFLNLGARERWRVNATLRPLYTSGTQCTEKGWASVAVLRVAENLAHIEVRIPDHPASIE
jgi:hypothetical protein